MQYIIDEQALNPTTQSFIEAGITENINLLHRAVMSDNGNPFLEFVYMNSEGQKVVKTEWKPSEMPRGFGNRTEGQNKYIESLMKQNSENEEQACKRADKITSNKQMQRIFPVLGLFVDLSTLKGREFTDFFDFAKFVSDSIGGVEVTEDSKTRRKRSENLRVKFVYEWNKKDQKDYVTTPNSKNVWIERADQVSAEDSLIKITSEDKMIKTQTTPSGSRAPQSSNPLENSNNLPETEDMPF